MKDWKTQCNKTLRKTSQQEDISKVWRKVTNKYFSPKDGGMDLWDNPKAYRK